MCSTFNLELMSMQTIFFEEEAFLKQTKIQSLNTANFGKAQIQKQILYHKFSTLPKTPREKQPLRSEVLSAHKRSQDLFCKSGGFTSVFGQKIILLS